MRTWRGIYVKKIGFIVGENLDERLMAGNGDLVTVGLN